MASEVRDDSVYIQNLIDTAVPDGSGVKAVTVPRVNPNDPAGGSVYQIGKAIELSSNTTVKLDNCTLRLNDGVLCNVFISKGCYDKYMTSEQELTNISVIGIGNAVIDGGVHNGVTEKTATGSNGFSSVRYNTSIHFRNVNGFKVSGITVKEPRYWGMTFAYCRNGEISDIRFDCSNDAPNQDGIDLRLGCNNIKISDINGAVGDDAVALTALSVASDTYFKVQGKDSDIHDVSIHNVRATSVGGHGIVRLLCHHGNKVYNIDIKNIDDIGTNHVYGVLRIGDNNYAGSGTPMAYGDINGITVDGVISNGKMAILAPNPNVTTDHVTVKNVTQKYAGGGVSNLRDASVSAVPMEPLKGCPIYSFEGGSKDGWEFNNNDIRTANGTFNGKSDAYTMWPIGKDRPGNGMYLELTTAVETDTSVYPSFRLQLTMAHMLGTDPDPQLLKIYYSTDGGQSWSTEPIPLTAKYHGDLWAISSSTKCDVWTFTSVDIAALTDKDITHLAVRPYGEDGSQILGAFRLISLEMVGEHITEYYGGVPATCVATGKIAHWKCTVCGGKFANKSCTSVLGSTTTAVDKVNGHSLSTVEAKEPTATEDGWEQHYKCTLCSKLFADEDGKVATTLQNVTVPATGSEAPDVGGDGGQEGGGETPEDDDKPSDSGQSGEGEKPDGDSSEGDGKPDGGNTVPPADNGGDGKDGGSPMSAILICVCGVVTAVAAVLAVLLLKEKRKK